MSNVLSNSNGNKNKREYWSTHVKQWEESKLSQQAYCTQAEINYTTFVYWKGLLSKRTEASQKQFVPLKVIPSVERFSEIQIKLPTGHVVSIPTHLDIKDIATLINLLGASHA